MKRLSKITLAVGVITIMLVNFISVSALGFDAEKTYNSVFVIESGSSLGSGFAIGENCIITNAHVIADQNSVIVSTYGGDRFSAEIYCIDSNLDIAVLCVRYKALLTPLQSCDDITVGDEVYAIGAPNSMAYTLTKGVVSSKDRKTNTQSYIQTDAAINSGNSGGPLLNDSGQIIGVNSYKMSNSEGIGLAIPIKSVISYLNENSIDTDEHGVVKGKIEIQSHNDNQNTNDSDNNRSSTEQQKENNIKDLALYIALGISIAVNISMTMVLVFQNRKNIDMKIDPSERTDFDIDILE